MKIIEFFIENSPENYTKTQIAEALSMGKGTIYDAWEFLEEFDLVKTISSDRKSRFYVLNKENKLVKQLLKIYATIEEL